MSLQLYSQIPGTQVKRDIDLSNATIQCDPKLLFPLGATQGGVPLNKENLAGKIAVEHDICNLDVNNLTVNGVLVAKGPAEVCNIVCPEDFRVTARNDTILESGNDIALLAGGELVTQSTTTTTIGAQDIVLGSGNNISLSAANQVKLGGSAAGVQMAFVAGTAANSLRMTQGNGTVAQAQAGNVNGVCGKLNVDAPTVVLPGSIVALPIPNNKVTSESVVLVTLDTTQIGTTDFLITSTTSIVNGQYVINVANITAGNIDIQDVIIHYLVINPDV